MPKPQPDDVENEPVDEPVLPGTPAPQNPPAQPNPENPNPENDGAA